MLNLLIAIFILIESITLMYFINKCAKLEKEKRERKLKELVGKLFLNSIYGIKKINENINMGKWRED